MSTAIPGYYEQQPASGFQDPRVIRGVGRCILLLIVSGGLWGIAWMYHTTKEVSSRVNSPAPSPGLRALLTVIPIANYVVLFLSWRDIENYCKRARSEDFPMVLFFVLSILLPFCALFTYPIVQSRMNQAHRAATNGQAQDAPMQTIDWVCVAIGIAYWAFLWLIVILGIIGAATS